MKAFVYRLIPPRSSFPFDMSEAERAVMVDHVAYWQGAMARGQVLAFGPVAHPDGSYGLGVILATDLDEAERLCGSDPAMRSPHGFRTEIAPIVRLVTPDGVYE